MALSQAAERSEGLRKALQTAERSEGCLEEREV